MSRSGLSAGGHAPPADLRAQRLNALVRLSFTETREHRGPLIEMILEIDRLLEERDFGPRGPESREMKQADIEYVLLEDAQMRIERFLQQPGLRHADRSKAIAELERVRVRLNSHHRAGLQGGLVAHL